MLTARSAEIRLSAEKLVLSVRLQETDESTVEYKYPFPSDVLTALKNDQWPACFPISPYFPDLRIRLTERPTVHWPTILSASYLRANDTLSVSLSTPLGLAEVKQWSGFSIEKDIAANLVVRDSRGGTLNSVFSLDSPSFEKLEAELSVALHGKVLDYWSAAPNVLLKVPLSGAPNGLRLPKNVHRAALLHDTTELAVADPPDADLTFSMRRFSSLVPATATAIKLEVSFDVRINDADPPRTTQTLALVLPIRRNSHDVFKTVTDPSTQLLFIGVPQDCLTSWRCPNEWIPLTGASSFSLGGHFSRQADTVPYLGERDGSLQAATWPFDGTNCKRRGWFVYGHPVSSTDSCLDRKEISVIVCTKQAAPPSIYTVRFWEAPLKCTLSSSSPPVAASSLMSLHAEDPGNGECVNETSLSFLDSSR